MEQKKEEKAGRSKNPEAYLEAAEKTRLFCGVSRACIAEQFKRSGVQVNRFEKGAVIYAPDGFTKSIGLLIRGRASVTKGGGETGMLMSVLHGGELFGAAALYGGEERYVATIRALESTWAVMMPEKAFREMIWENPKIAENYIVYLTSRIRFLSNRIDGFAEQSAEDRVLHYIKKNCVNGVYTPECSIRAIGDALCIGRTTLYRSFEKLQQQGKIYKDGRSFRLYEGEEET